MCFLFNVTYYQLVRCLYQVSFKWPLLPSTSCRAVVAVLLCVELHKICYHLCYILFELHYMITAVYCYFSLFDSLCLVLLSVLFSVSFFVLLYIFAK